MKEIKKELEAVKTIGISGHIRPDGDCVGAVMGLYLYLRKTLPQAEIDVLLEKPGPVFDRIYRAEAIRSDLSTGVDSYDVFYALDTAEERLGEARPFFTKAKQRINIDHHISNSGCGDMNIIDPQASSTSELIYDYIGGAGSLDAEIAQALYIGIIHDTGVFQHSNTSAKTLRIAAELIGFGFDFSQLITETFYEKTYIQNQILGRALLESIIYMNGKCIVGSLDKKTMEFYDASPPDMEGIVNQLLITQGVECAIFMYQTGICEFKVSLRSKGSVDVAAIASFFGGGGHVRAAGVTMNGTFHDIANNLSYHINKQLPD